MNEFDKDATIAYDIEIQGHRFTAVDCVRDESRIEISKDGIILKRFMFPSYKIWNIPAHADDIIKGIDSGLRIAGSDGLGGNLYGG